MLTPQAIEPIYKAKHSKKKAKSQLLVFNVIVSVFVLALVAFIFVTVGMYKRYIRNTEQIIKTNTNIESANAWERLPSNQRKEILREQYYQIVRLYTNQSPEAEKMNDVMILSTFNQLWDCTSRVPSVNFFLPVAYMKVVTNFNPNYNVKYRYGIAAFIHKDGERISNLPIIQKDTSFQLTFKGMETLIMPTESVKLLVAKIDDLMITFNGRVDWVLLSLFTNEYDVIDKYWDGGRGAISDELYKTGNLANALMYYQSFKNWQIPAPPAKPIIEPVKATTKKGSR